MNEWKTKEKEVNALLSLFKIEGRRGDEALTPSQKEIFYHLVFQPRKRLVINVSTQYGKSLVTALACVILSTVREKVVSVVAPTKEKGKIIMRYYIEHLGDNPVFYTQLEKKTKLERLRQEESKERIILQNGGGVFVVSANQRNYAKSLESAMGLGAEITIMDEACLIKDDTESTIFRMIGGRGSDAFYCKIGNPFYKQKPYSHFYQSWRDPRYKKIHIDYKIGLEEGRYTEDFISEAKKKPNFRVLFESKFPLEDTVDIRGYAPLFNEDDLDEAYIDEAKLGGLLKAGIDVAGGGRNRSVIVIRGANAAKVAYYARNEDTMSFVGDTFEICSEEQAFELYADVIGVGKGYCDRLLEEAEPRFTIHPINTGMTPENKEDFINIRAEASWRAREWIKQGGKLIRHEGWEQLLNIRYKTQSSRKIKIISKEELLKDGIESPDVWDAFALTFVDKPKSQGQVSSYTPKLREYNTGTL